MNDFDQYPQRVLIIHRIIAPYRVPFYEKLRNTLLNADIDLQIIYGHPREHETDPYDNLDFGIQVKTKYFYLGSRFLVWLSALRYVNKYDLVIVQQANNNLLNYVLIAFRKFGRFRLAFWGHGKNFQAANEYSFGEQFKKLYSKHADHWFAYTDMSKAAVAGIGFPVDRITSVNNSIDTDVSIRMYESIDDHEISALRSKFGISEGSPIGIFCSRLYYLKRLDFLLHCLEKIKNEVKDFHFFVIGSGEEESKIKEFSHKNDLWFHYLGALFGMDKIRFFKLAQFQLMPGGVGLNIVESFVLLTPLITTRHTTHGPEIVYLKNGINGVMTDDNIELYVRQVVACIKNPSRLDQLVKGCLDDRHTYSIDNMVNRFVTGIQTVLSARDRL